MVKIKDSTLASKILEGDTCAVRRRALQYSRPCQQKCYWNDRMNIEYEQMLNTERSPPESAFKYYAFQRLNWKL